jgi:hypothetical protein
MVDREQALPDVDALQRVELAPLPARAERDKQLREIFQSLDCDGNGFLDRNEFHKAVEAVGLPGTNAYLKVSCCLVTWFCHI